MWRLSVFRLLLFAAFSYLSLQATRNSHQFAAVVGTITAWNFGEWAAALRRRRVEQRAAEAGPAPMPSLWMPRLVAGAAIVAVIAWVGSGLFYRMTGEGRTIAMGEEPLFFPHEAARFAGRPEMPAKFVSFHNANASLFEFYHGPERKVYTDPRLEIAGPEFYSRYMKLSTDLTRRLPGWQAELDRIGRPVILVDHEYSYPILATLLGDDHWRCVWFDSIAAVFVHDSVEQVVREYSVDFAARHFRPEPATSPSSLAERIAWPGRCASTRWRSRRIAPNWSGRCCGWPRTRAAASSSRCPTRPSPGRCSARPSSPAIPRRRSRPALGIACPSTRSSTSRPFGRRTRCAGGSSFSPTSCGR